MRTVHTNVRRAIILTSPRPMPPGSSACRFGVILLGVLVIAAFAGSSAYDAWRSYRHAVMATDREITNVANALAEQTAWSLQAVDLLLLDTARWYRYDSQSIPPERLGAILRPVRRECGRCAK